MREFFLAGIYLVKAQQVNNYSHTKQAFARNRLAYKKKLSQIVGSNEILKIVNAPKSEAVGA